MAGSKEVCDMTTVSFPVAQGLYDPRFEHDACGVGFVADLKNRKKHDIIRKAIQVLINLEHRGACGCEANTGDGAGIIMQTPDGFLRQECDRLNIRLPAPGEYGVGMVFLPADPHDRRHCEDLFEYIVRKQGQDVLGWRTVPTDNSQIGPTARLGEPVMKQVFIGRQDRAVRVLGNDDLAFERRLYVIRRCVENAVSKSGLTHHGMFYIPSLSCKTLIYKGMLNSLQLDPYFPDLNNPAMQSALALVHSRFSTNTFPTWARAHPYRYICHNGEINTLRGNVNWMKAREKLMRSDLFGMELARIMPVIDESGSDSAMFDNALELLVLSGRSLPHAVMMMIPEPWSGDSTMSPEKRAFYEYHSCLMEPWDGPASIAFTDGRQIGAVLDRNGLRPSRYYVTKDDLVIMGSEVGVLEVAPENVLIKGRLQPGRMFLVDLEQGRIIADDELKFKIATEHPYADWLRDNIVALEELPGGEVATVETRGQSDLSDQRSCFPERSVHLESCGNGSRRSAIPARI